MKAKIEQVGAPSVRTAKSSTEMYDGWHIATYEGSVNISISIICLRCHQSSSFKTAWVRVRSQTVI